MKFAVIETGGKQYLVSEGQKLKIEKLKTSKGDDFNFDKVLMVADDTKLELGKPYLNQTVEAKLIKDGRARKITVLKYKSKKRYRVKRGHRQPYAEIQITKIEGAAKKPATVKSKPASKPAAKTTVNTKK